MMVKVLKELADDLWLWRQESKHAKPENFIFSNRLREGNGGSGQQRTAIEVKKRRRFLKFPGKRVEAGPLSVRKNGGPGRDRTDDLFHAMEARSQLRHRPTRGWSEYSRCIYSHAQEWVSQTRGERYSLRPRGGSSILYKQHWCRIAGVGQSQG